VVRARLARLGPYSTTPGAIVVVSGLGLQGGLGRHHTQAQAAVGAYSLQRLRPDIVQPASRATSISVRLG
jgi:hypothetical protein